MSKLFYKELNENETFKKAKILCFIKFWNIMHNMKKSKDLISKIINDDSNKEILGRSEFEINKYTSDNYLDDNNRNENNYIDKYLSTDTLDLIRSIVDEIVSS